MSPRSFSPEDELAAACARGETAQFDALYERHVRGIYGFISYRVLDRALAEDLTSTVFLKALESIRSYDPSKGAFSTWLYRIARNTVFDHFRTRKTAEPIESAWDLAGEDDPLQDAADAESRRDVRKALRSLEKDKREIVMMRLWDGLSYAEIAALTGKSEAACKMTFSRAVASLRDTMPLAAFLLFLLSPPPLS